MRIQYLHDITLKLLGDLTIWTVPQPFLSSHIDQEPLILQDGQFILEDRDPLDQFLALDSQLLIHCNVFNDDVCEVVSSGI